MKHIKTFESFLNENVFSGKIPAGPWEIEKLVPRQITAIAERMKKTFEAKIKLPYPGDVIYNFDALYGYGIGKVNMLAYFDKATKEDRDWKKVYEGLQAPLKGLKNEQIAVYTYKGTYLIYVMGNYTMNVYATEGGLEAFTELQKYKP